MEELIESIPSIKGIFVRNNRFQKRKGAQDVLQVAIGNDEVDESSPIYAGFDLVEDDVAGGIE